MEDYKSPCAAVIICATLVNVQTHRQTAFDQLLSTAEPAELPVNGNKSSCNCARGGDHCHRQSNLQWLICKTIAIYHVNYGCLWLCNKLFNSAAANHTSVACVIVVDVIVVHFASMPLIWQPTTYLLSSQLYCKIY